MLVKNVLKMIQDSSLCLPSMPARMHVFSPTEQRVFHQSSQRPDAGGRTCQRERAYILAVGNPTFFSRNCLVQNKLCRGSYICTYCVKLGAEHTIVPT